MRRTLLSCLAGLLLVPVVARAQVLARGWSPPRSPQCGSRTRPVASRAVPGGDAFPARRADQRRRRAMQIADAGQSARNSSVAATRAGTWARSILANPTLAKYRSAVVVRMDTARQPRCAGPDRVGSSCIVSGAGRS